MIKIAYTKQGAIIGTFESHGDGFYVENPCMLIPQQNNVASVPVLGLCQTQKMFLNSNELVFKSTEDSSGLFEPALELRNAFSENYGSGVVLLKG